MAFQRNNYNIINSENLSYVLLNDSYVDGTDCCWRAYTNNNYTGTSRLVSGKINLLSDPLNTTSTECTEIGFTVQSLRRVDKDWET